MENIILTLFAVAFIAFKAIKQYKKETAKIVMSEPVEATEQTTVEESLVIPITSPTAARPKKSVQTAKPQKVSGTPAALFPQEPETESEYAIRSAEEARRAIVWSEILQRKY